MDYLGKKALLEKIRRMRDEENQRLSMKKTSQGYEKDEIDKCLYEIEKEPEIIDKEEKYSIDKPPEQEDKAGFDHVEKGPREKTIDRETFIAILRACGYPIPMTKEEWQEYVKKTADFLKKLNKMQSRQVVGSAKRTARTIVEATSKYSDINKEEVRETAYIPLKKSKSKGLNVFEDFEGLSDEQKDVVVEAVVTGIRGQEKAMERAMLAKQEEAASMEKDSQDERGL